MAGLMLEICQHLYYCIAPAQVEQHSENTMQDKKAQSPIHPVGAVVHALWILRHLANTALRIGNARFRGIAPSTFRSAS